MSSMSEHPNTTLNGHPDQGLGLEPELMFDADTAKVAVEAETESKVGINLEAEPLSFDSASQTEPTAKTQTPKEGNWWQQRSLKTKTTLAAIALATMPLISVSFVADRIASRAVSTQIETAKQARVNALARRLGMFMRERYRDTQAIAQAPLFSDPALSTLATLKQKESLLTNNMKVNGKIFSSIALFDLNGNVITQSEGGTQARISELPAFREVLQTAKSVVVNPETVSGTIAAQFLVPVKDSTGKVTGVVRSIVPLTSLYSSVEDLATFGDEIHAIDSKGNFVFVSKDDMQLFGKPADVEFPGFSQRLAQNPEGSSFHNDATNNQRLIAYKTQDEIPGMPSQLNWVGITTLDGDIALKPIKDLELTIILGTLIAAAAIAGVSVLLAGRAIRPILTASEAVQKLGEGDLDTRVQVSGTDEMAALGSNINLMAGQIQSLLVGQQQAAQEQLAAQAEIATQQAKAAKEQQDAKEFLQNRALELLMQVGPLRQGDLTIRAEVTEDEIGTIADSYNATIASLRKLVAQVQAAAGQVASTADTSETSIQDLSEDTVLQTKAIQAALDQITNMGNSIRLVASNAQSAEKVMQVASQTVQQGDAAMDKTVAGILAIRETVAETAKKVKQLGESSQKISKVVNLISSFADQTNLLALNASIEAARAGEEGRGFAVVADEVRSLARQSANATAEIEALVAGIQSETNEVVMAMETGTQQVVTGTQLVEETRQSLNQITQASEQITELVRSIASAATQQSEASVVVSETMTDVAGIASNTSDRATQVLSAFQDLLTVAQDLQTTVGQFKLQ
jgi:methyl-accepting chemotaxis protein PixJ